MSAESKASHTSTHIPEPLFTRLIVAPVLFVSFIISLFLIDRQTYGAVFSHHSNPSSAHEPHSATSHESDGDHYHSHKRKLARQEMEDAFAMRSKVIAAFAILAGVSVAVMGWGGSKFVYALTGR